MFYVSPDSETALTVALICGLMNVDVKQRMTLEEAMNHPWVRRYLSPSRHSNRRPNRMLTQGGYLADPLTLAQRLMEKLQVDLSDDLPVTASSSELYAFLLRN